MAKSKLRRITTFSVCVFACLCFVLTDAASVQAIPLSDYQKSLQQAITALDTLLQQDEDETDSDFESRVKDTTQAIRTAIPETQMVQSTGDTYSVQNSWLHNELGELDKASADERQKWIVQLVDHLRALDERITEARTPHEFTTNPTDAKQKLDTILHRPEYQSEAKKGSSVIARLLREFFRWLESLFPKRRQLQSEQATSLSRKVQVVVLGLCLLVILYVLRTFVPRLMRRRKVLQKEKPKPRIVLGEKIAPEQSASDLLDEAERLARDGQLRSAIRKGYIALLVELGDRHLVSLAQYKTNRDYLNSVRNTPSLYENLSGLTDRFERHWYGAVQATQTDWQEFRAVYLATLRSGA
jgi:hypothetical protein